MTIIVRDPVKYEGVHYAPGTYSLDAALELRMVNDGEAVWQTPPDTISDQVRVVIGPDRKIKSFKNPDDTEADVGSGGLSSIASELQKAFDAGRFYGPQILRHVSVLSRTNVQRLRANIALTGSTSSGKRRFLTYMPIRIGSGDVASMTIVLENQFYDSTLAGCPPSPNTNSVLITRAQIQRQSFGTPIVQLSRNGVTVASSPITMAATDFDLVLDEVTPSQFGLTTFAVDSEYVAAVEMEVDWDQFFCTIDESSKLPFPPWLSQYGYFYDPAITTWNHSNTAQPVSPTFSTGGVMGTQVQTRSGVGMFAVGKFANGDPLTLNTFGDSIVARGIGLSFAEQLYRNKKIAGCIIGRGGATSTAMLSGARSTYLTKYANSAIIEHGTNSSAESLASLQSRINIAMSVVRAAAVQSPRNNKFNVILTNLLVGENRTNNTILWNAGGTVEQYNDWMYTQVGLPTGPDIVVDGSVGPFGTIRASTEGKGVTNSDYYRWGVGMLADGAVSFAVHPTEAASVIIADNIFPQLPVY